MSISKKIRFEVFKRDKFTCQYCGSNPPNVTLEVDHIQPKSKNGTDDINNLITACFDCNRGKSNVELKSIPNTLIENMDMIQEKEDQYLEYQKLLRKVNRRINKELDSISEIYTSYFLNYEFNESFKRTSLKKFISMLGLESVVDAAHIAFNKFQLNNEKDSEMAEDAIKYFCGICWNKINNE